MKLLVISPHPDDETLGAGGAILRMISQGHQASWLNITNMKEEYGYSAKAISTRAAEIERVREETGYSAFYDLGLRPAGLSQYEETALISRMKEVFDEVRPELVFLPFRGDAHSDHRVVYNCAMACTKTFRAPYIHKVVCMEILSETNYAAEPFRADCFVDISDYIDEKLRLLSIYRSEFKAPPFPRSMEGVRAQARFRGTACFREYAEAFQIIKEVL